MNIWASNFVKLDPGSAKLFQCQNSPQNQPIQRQEIGRIRRSTNKNLGILETWKLEKKYFTTEFKTPTGSVLEGKSPQFQGNPSWWNIILIGSVYGIFTYMKTMKINHENVGEYTVRPMDPSWVYTLPFETSGTADSALLLIVQLPDPTHNPSVITWICPDGRFLLNTLSWLVNLPPPNAPPT